MANIPALQETYNGAAAGTAISSSNTIFDNISGSATSNLFHDSAPPESTNKSQRIVCGGGNSINRADLPTPVPALYLSMYIYIEAHMATTGAFLNWYAGATKVGDLRLFTDGAIQLRDAAANRWTGSPLALNEWHRVELMCNPGEATGHLCNVWSGANVHGTTTPSQTSGAQSSTQAGAAAGDLVTDIRLGVIANDAASIMRFSRIRGDDAGFPAPVQVSTPNVAPVARAGADQIVDPYQLFTLNSSASTDADGTIVSHVWEQIAGPATPLSGTGAVRTGVAPATMAGTTLTYRVTTTDNSGATSTDDVNIVVRNHNLFRVAADGVTRVPIRRSRVS